MQIEKKDRKFINSAMKSFWDPLYGGWISHQLVFSPDMSSMSFYFRLTLCKYEAGYQWMSANKLRSQSSHLSDTLMMQSTSSTFPRLMSEELPFRIKNKLFRMERRDGSLFSGRVGCVPCLDLFINHLLWSDGNHSLWDLSWGFCIVYVFGVWGFIGGSTCQRVSIV